MLTLFAILYVLALVGLLWIFLHFRRDPIITYSQDDPINDLSDLSRRNHSVKQVLDYNFLNASHGQLPNGFLPSEPVGPVIPKTVGLS